MKNKSKRKLYDALCILADVLMERYNPCEWKDGKCLRGVTCCAGCKYLVSDKCTIKCLDCKLWLCDEVKKKYPDLAFIMQGLIDVSHETNLSKWRTPKNKVV